MKSLPPRWMLLSLTIILFLAATPIVHAQEPAGDLHAALDALFAQQRAVLHIPGLVFVLVADGEIAFSHGVGLADVREEAKTLRVWW